MVKIGLLTHPWCFLCAQHVGQGRRVVQLEHGGYGRGGVSDADSIGDAPCRHRDGRRNLQNGKVYIKKAKAYYKTHYFKIPNFCPKTHLEFWVKIWGFLAWKNTKNPFLEWLNFYRIGWVDFLQISKIQYKFCQSYFLDKNLIFNIQCSKSTKNNKSCRTHHHMVYLLLW